MPRLVKAVIFSDDEISALEIQDIISGQMPAFPSEKTVDTRFEECVNIIFGKEGGYGNDPDDAGGPTNMGITQGALSHWLKRPATVQDVKDLTRETAKQIYYDDYWLPSECDALPKGVDLALFNIVVNAGVFRGQQLFQETLAELGVYKGKIDGDIGEKTALALSQVNPIDFLNMYEVRIGSYYQSLNKFWKFGKGWMNRLEEIMRIARKTVITGKPEQMPEPSLTLTPSQKGNSMMTLIDLWLGGEFFKGKKTVIGIIAWVILSLEYKIDFIPDTILTPDMQGSLYTIAIGLAGLGFVSKFERYMRIIVPNLPKLPQENKPSFDPFGDK